MKSSKLGQYQCCLGLAGKAQSLLSRNQSTMKVRYLSKTKRSVQPGSVMVQRARCRACYPEEKVPSLLSKNFFMGSQEPLLETVKRHKLTWFGHVMRHDSLSKTILRGILEGGRRRARQRKCRIDNVKEWTPIPMQELLTRASCRKDWKRVSAESSLMSLRRPSRSRN